MKHNFILILLFLNFFSTLVFGQVAISYDAAIDQSAELTIESTDKGLLIPILTTNEINTIESPANGLFVFDQDDNMIKYFNNSKWTMVGELQKYTTAGRPASSTTEGIMIYDTDLNQILYFDGSSWKALVQAP